MGKYSDTDITKLQNNLLLIRNAGGWTAEVFGDMIGVTKQTISNLENKKTEMTKTQYIAIRAVLDYEMEENPNREILKSAVNLALHSDEVSEEDQKKIQAFVSGAQKTGLDSAAVIARNWSDYWSCCCRGNCITGFSRCIWCMVSEIAKEQA